MADYEPNTSKPERLLSVYGSVRGAELKSIYTHVEPMTPRSQIEELFGRPRKSGLETDHIDNCIRFLRTLDMLEETEEDILSPINRDVFEAFPLSFEPRLLHHVRQQPERQKHLADIHEVAIRDVSSTTGYYGVRRVSVDDLVVTVDRETEYDLEWREEKIEMWANFLAPVGGLSFSTENDEILLSPSRALLFELLVLHQDHRPKGDSILAAFEWIDEEFFPVFSRTGGEPAVHVGVADVLETLVADEALTLTGMSDRSEVVDLPTSIDDTRTPAEYSIEAVPDRPSYWYPLDRTERRCIA